MNLSRFIDFATNEEGVTAIEYAMIAGIVAIGIVSSVTLLKTSLQSEFGSVASSFNSTGN